MFLYLIKEIKLDKLISLKTSDGKIIELPIDEKDFNEFKPLEVTFKNRKKKTLVYSLRVTQKAGLVLN